MMKLFISLVSVFVVASASLQETAALRVQRWVGQNGRGVGQNGSNVPWPVQSLQPQVSKNLLEPKVGGWRRFTRWGNKSRQSPRQAERPNQVSEQVDEQNGLWNVTGQDEKAMLLK